MLYQYLCSMRSPAVSIEHVQSYTLLCSFFWSICTVFVVLQNGESVQKIFEIFQVVLNSFQIWYLQTIFWEAHVFCMIECDIYSCIFDLYSKFFKCIVYFFESCRDYHITTILEKWTNLIQIYQKHNGFNIINISITSKVIPIQMNIHHPTVKWKNDVDGCK